MFFFKTPKLFEILYPKAVWHGRRDQKQVYLTFDDGPIPVVTDYILDLLSEHEIKATFFCVGENVSKYPETYVHRIGRTGRASASGIALSFCDLEERVFLRDIQKLIEQKIPVIENHPFVHEVHDEKPVEKVPQHRGHNRPKPINRNSEPGSNPNKKRRRKYYAKKRV